MFAKRLALLLLVLALAIGGIFTLRPRQPEQNQTSFSLKVENGVKGVFYGQEVMPPAIDLAAAKPTDNILGETDPTEEKHIYVDLANQTLTAYEGDKIFLKTLVSTGKWGKTPTGEFTIWSKFRATRMSGGQGNDYYNLPNVPYVMFFSGPGIAASRGFALHGTYWHNNFGHPMSHGCVNMRTVDAEKLFYWADINYQITIYGQAPG